MVVGCPLLPATDAPPLTQDDSSDSVDSTNQDANATTQPTEDSPPSTPASNPADASPQTPASSPASQPTPAIYGTYSGTVDILEDHHGGFCENPVPVTVTLHSLTFDNQEYDFVGQMITKTDPDSNRDYTITVTTLDLTNSAADLVLSLTGYEFNGRQEVTLKLNADGTVAYLQQNNGDSGGVSYYGSCGGTLNKVAP